MYENEWKPIQNLGAGRIAINNANGALFEISIALLTFFTLMTPRDAMGFKKAFLAISLVLGMPAILGGLRTQFKIFVFSIFLPLAMYVMSSVMTGSATAALGYLYPFVYILLVFPILYWNIDIAKITLRVGDIMAALILISVLLDVLGVVGVYSNPILMWLDANGEAKISTSRYAMFRYVLFLNASPILLFNLMHYVKENKIIKIILVFASLLFTGTRANIFLAAAIVFVTMLFYSKKWWVRALIIIATVVVVVFFGSELIVKYETINFAKATGDASRTGSVESIIRTINSDKIRWFTGMGFGSEYYSTGKLGIVETSEMSYLEFIREAGIPFFSITFGFILYPLVKVFKKNRFYFAFYLAYLVAGFFEPFIFTSTGFFVIMLMYCVVMQDQIRNAQYSYNTAVVHR